MNKYELIYIIDTAVEEQARKGLIERFSGIIVDNGGKIEKIDEWGKRRLAYTIDYKTEGYYVLINYEAEGDVPKEVERNLEINENIIRYLTVKLEEKTSKVKPRASRPAPTYGQPAREAAPQGRQEVKPEEAKGEEAVKAPTAAEEPKVAEAPAAVEEPKAVEAPTAVEEPKAVEATAEETPAETQENSAQ
ncbi:MAG: 30S ribosomal protein S6 [Clostridiales bacterium]|nr:30S ribosomal protein S6 [Clostridiales bacterium]